MAIIFLSKAWAGFKTKDCHRFSFELYGSVLERDRQSTYCMHSGSGFGSVLWHSAGCNISAIRGRIRWGRGSKREGGEKKEGERGRERKTERKRGSEKERVRVSVCV